MNEQSQYLQGQLLNELDTLSEELSESLNLGNLSSVNSDAAKSGLIDATGIETSSNTANEPPHTQRSNKAHTLEEFTSTLFEDANELAQLLFSADDSKNKNAVQQFSEEEIDLACSQIGTFFRSLLNKHSTSIETQP